MPHVPGNNKGRLRVFDDVKSHLTHRTSDISVPLKILDRTCFGNQTFAASHGPLISNNWH